MSAAAMARAYPGASALILADADFAEQATPLLAAQEAAIFHADALSGCNFENGGMADMHAQHLRWTLSQAHQHAANALEELRGKIAGDHGLWDGIDPADIPLMRVAEFARSYRRECAA